MIHVLVTGGAGYIGAMTCKYLAKRGYVPIVLDNLSRGHKNAVRWGPSIEKDLSEPALLSRIFRTYSIAAVIHFAALCYVGESVRKPSLYYRNNVCNTLNLLDNMIAHNVSKLIFSSSCATYGEPQEIPITEEHRQDPISPYGRTKFMVEQVLRDFHQSHGLEYAALRYFNAAGADPEGELGEDHRPETHLIPLLLHAAAAGKREARIFGSNYATRDGTCIRDYVHVEDLAQAHYLALERILGGGGSGFYNLGNDAGHSVKEVINAVASITGRTIPVREAEPRPGDPAVLVSSSEKAKRELNWKPRFGDINDIIATAWRWHSSHPNGFLA